MLVDINNEHVSDNNEMCWKKTLTSLNQILTMTYSVELFESVLTGDICIDMICQAPVQQQIQEQMNAYSDRVRQESRTARLCLQYMEMV